MTGTEPAAELALVVADRLSLRNAAEMGADADHHQPGLAVLRRAVIVARRRVFGKIGVARERIDQVVDGKVLRLGNLLVGAVADEDRLCAPHNGG